MGQPARGFVKESRNGGKKSVLLFRDTLRFGRRIASWRARLAKRRARLANGAPGLSNYVDGLGLDVSGWPAAEAYGATMCPVCGTMSPGGPAMSPVAARSRRIGQKGPRLAIGGGG